MFDNTCGVHLARDLDPIVELTLKDYKMYTTAGEPARYVVFYVLQ